MQSGCEGDGNDNGNECKEDASFLIPIFLSNCIEPEMYGEEQLTLVFSFYPNCPSTNFEPAIIILISCQPKRLSRKLFAGKIEN